MSTLLAKRLNTTTLSPPKVIKASGKINQTNESFTLIPLLSAKKTKNSLIDAKVNKTSLYSIGYIVNSSTPSKPSTAQNKSSVPYQTITSTPDLATSTSNHSKLSDPTTTTFPPTTLDYTTPFTTATKPELRLLNMISAIGPTKGTVLS